MNAQVLREMDKGMVKTIFGKNKKGETSILGKAYKPKKKLLIIVTMKGLKKHDNDARKAFERGVNHNDYYYVKNSKYGEHFIKYQLKNITE